MAIKESIEQLSSMIAPEKVEQGRTILKTLENEFIDLSASKSASDSESKGRKLKIREMEGVLEDREMRIVELDNKIKSFDDSAIKKERDAYAQKYKSALKLQQEYFKSNFDVVEKHPNFEPVLKVKFKVPEKEGDQYKWDSLKEDEWEHNIQTFNELNSLKYFESAPKPSPDRSKGGHNREGVRIPTSQETMELRAKYGLDSPEYRNALKAKFEQS